MRISHSIATVLTGLVLGVALVAQQPQEPAPAGAPAGAPGAGRGAAAGRQGGGGAGRGGRGTMVEIAPGAECPPGMTEARPHMCQAPEFPVPSIVDYRPQSQLVTAQHLVPKAKFPVVDYHGHPGNLIANAEGLATLATALDALNVRVMVSADNTSGARLVTTLAAIRNSPQRDRVRVLAGVDFSNVGPGWAEKAIAQLEADLKAGAVGIGEISKALGLRTRKPDGSRLKIDDPEMDAFWEACARLNLPVFIHTADPAEFFQPIDFHNERWLELSLFNDRRYPQPEFPSFETLVAERDHLFAKHPKTRFVMAHLGWQANDLGAVSKVFDAMPNVSSEIGAVLYDLGRQPRAAHDFFVKYQDRILFGKDLYAPEEYPYYWRVLETKDEYFDYYRDYHAFWKLYGIDLPDEVLKKVYFGNALKLTPGILQTGWPK